MSGTTFDVLSGTPTVPLTLVAASSIDDNIGILTYLGSQTIFGDKSFATGEGAISILLDSVSNIFGYEVVDKKVFNLPYVIHNWEGKFDKNDNPLKRSLSS